MGVVVTRSENEGGPLTALLRERGVRVLHWGSIAFAPPDDPAPFQEALDRIRGYDWICFSSPRAVAAVLDRLPLPPEGVRVAAVGTSTARALEDGNWPVHRVPEVNRGEALVEAFREGRDARDARILFPGSEIARDVIPEGLSALGGQVDRVTAYRTVPASLNRDRCRAQVDGGEVDVITFTSPSAATNLAAALGEELMARLTAEVPAAAIGPTTRRALVEMGWRTVAVAEPHTLEALARTAVEAGGSTAGTMPAGTADTRQNRESRNHES